MCQCVHIWVAVRQLTLRREDEHFTGEAYTYVSPVKTQGDVG